MKEQDITYKELLDDGKNRLLEANIEDASVDAWLLLEYVFQINRTWYFVHEDDMAETKLARKYKDLIKIRSNHIPLQQITHEAYFYGEKFYVDQHVLIPRQDTEVLVEEVLKLQERIFPKERKENLEILDVCTGSGCILLSLLKNLDHANGMGVDLSLDALEVAKRNGQNLKIDAKWCYSDLFDNVHGTYDMIVSNPPYIKTDVIEELMEEVKFHEPRMALDGREDGLYFYRKIVEQADEYLRKGGILAFEIGYDQGEDVKNLMTRQGYEQVRVIQDLAGLDRCVIGIK